MSRRPFARKHQLLLVQSFLEQYVLSTLLLALPGKGKSKLLKPNLLQFYTAGFHPGL